MALNKNDCIAAVKQAGASELEALDIVDMLLEQKARLKASGDLTPQNLSRAWSATAEGLARQRAIQRRRTALGLVKFREAAGFVDSAKAQGVSAMEGIQALMVGISRRFDGARRSVSALRQGIFKSWASPMLSELEAVDNGAALRLMREDKAFHDSVFREMREPDSTGDKNARAIADIFSRYTEQSRVRLNAAGADIGKLDGWTPQTHDPYKLMAGGEAGRAKWVDFMLPRLDLERTFDGVGLVDANRARELLNGVYDTLTMGRNPHMPGDFTGGGASVPGPRNLASGMGKSRVLHFKDAQGALEYHDAYGRGNIFDAMLRHLEQDARALALMERLGPNPQYTLERLLAHEKRALKDNAVLTPEEKARQMRELDNAFSGGIIRQGRVSAWLAELTGETNWAAHPTLARVGAVLRASQNLSKLGGASLSAIADVFTKAASMRVNGETWPGAIGKSLAQYIQGFSGKEKDVARQCGAFLDHVRGDIVARWDDASGMPGVLADLQDKLFRWSGLNWITERGKAGYTLWLSEHLGEASGKAFDQLDGPRRAMLQYHGVDPERWEAMRKMSHQAEDGKAYFTPEAAAYLTDADLAPLLPEHAKNAPPDVQARELARIRDSLRFDSMAMLADETAFAIIEPDDATRAIMRQGTRPGTGAGEIWRAIMQFKSFPIAYMQRVLGGRCWVRGDLQKGMRYGPRNLPGAVGDALTRDMGGLMGFVLSSVAFGYASMTLKDLAKGRKPRSLAHKETWLAAAMQSGGAGIFGDILFGKVNRFGNSFAETAVGPLGGLIGDAATLGGQLVRGDMADAGEDTLRLAMGNAPFINLWYTRAALDWMLLYHVREMMSPGTLRRTERKMKKEFGQEFLFPPSQFIRRGGGFR